MYARCFTGVSKVSHIGPTLTLRYITSTFATISNGRMQYDETKKTSLSLTYPPNKAAKFFNFIILYSAVLGHDSLKTHSFS